MCAHIRQNRHIYRRVYSAYILTRTPSPFCAGSLWGLLSRKIFFDFYFPDFARNLSEVWIEIIFLNFTLVILTSNNFFIFFRDFVPIGFILDFIQNICRFNSLQVFSRYSSRLISLYFSRL